MLYLLHDMSIEYCQQCNEHIDTDFRTCSHLDDQSMLLSISYYDFEELYEWETDDDDVREQIEEHLKENYPSEWRNQKIIEAEELAAELAENR